MKDNLYFGGVPTEPEIRALRERWPDDTLSEGQTITYGEIAEVIQATPRSNRFQGVVARWRKLVETETGKILRPNRLGALAVLDPRGVLSLSRDTLRSAGRKTRRAHVVTTRCDVRRLTDEDRAALLKVQQTSAAMLACGQLRNDKTDLPSITDAVTRGNYR